MALIENSILKRLQAKQLGCTADLQVAALCLVETNVFGVSVSYVTIERCVSCRRPSPRMAEPVEAIFRSSGAAEWDQLCASASEQGSGSAG